jgi:hypothetical protein
VRVIRFWDLIHSFFASLDRLSVSMGQGLIFVA